MATLKELADQTGYSPATISRILSGDPALSVTPEARRKVLEEAGRLNYTATRSRRGRTPKGVLRVGVAEMLTPAQQLDDPYYLYLSSFVRQGCMDKKYTCLTLESRGEGFLPPEGEKLDGIVAIGLFTPAQIESLAALTPNVVFVDSSPFEQRFDSVVLGYELGISLALEHLTQLGHRHIGYIGPVYKLDDYRRRAPEVRRQLFLKLMERHNLLEGAQLLDCPMEAQAAARAVGELLASGEQEAALSEGRRVHVYVWSRAIQRNELSADLQKKALRGLSGLNIGVFTVVAVLMYLLMLSPIVRLRKTMRRYYEKGDRPERSERQDEIGKLQNAFADLVGVLECKEKAEHQLIASISHDIKTPLTSVLGYSERLRSAELSPEKRQQYLDSVYEKALRLKSIVDEFDDYLDVGLRDTAPMRLMTVEAFCEKLRMEYESELMDADVLFRIECRCPQEQIICNWEHMRRFFGNLIGNSIQHARAGHLELRLRCCREGEQVVFLFWDNGKGVPPELLQQIFEPLYTTDPGRKVSGLGLPICKSIMKAHGGTVGAESGPEGGLLVRASLPCVHL